MTCKSEEHRDHEREGDWTRDPPFQRVVQAFQRSWVIELVALVVLFAAYNVIRGSAGKDAIAAFAHADDILRAESWLFPHLEVPLNEWMSQITWVAVPACYFYALMHYAATPGILLLSRRIGGWYYWRGYWTLVLASAIALVIYALYPVAPPRLIPGLGNRGRDAAVRHLRVVGKRGLGALPASATPPTSTPPCRRCTSGGRCGARSRCGASGRGCGAASPLPIPPF